MKLKSLHQRVYEYCNLHWNHGKKSIAAHFIDENVPKSTIYDNIKRWENGLPPNRKKGSGWKPQIMTKTNIKRLEEFIHNQKGISTRKLAKKFKCDHSCIVKTIKRKTDIQYRKKLLVPYRTDTQKSVTRPKCGQILQTFCNHEFT